MAIMLFASVAAADEVIPYIPTTSIVISIPEQKLTVLRDGCFWRKYPISTSKYGVGDSFGSYKTPVGHLRVCEKIGEELAAGSVIKQRHATGEVLPANAPGRDPIVTRILWLDGLEEQNHNARSRGIYIHGTTEEGKIGQPVSYGCIRMRSKDVLDVFEEANIDTQVSIIAEKFPHYAKYTPPKPKIIASAPPPKPAAAPAKPAVAAGRPAASTGVVVASTSPAGAPLPPIASAPTVLFSARKASAPASLPPPVAEYRPPPVEPTVVVHGEVTMTNVSSSAVAQAMQGSILSAGLPDGPTIPKLPEPPAPKDVTRFGQLAPSPVGGKGLTLQDPALDTTPAIRAAAVTNSRPAGTVAKDAENGDGPANAGPNIAFRASPANGKPKQ